MLPQLQLHHPSMPSASDPHQLLHHDLPVHGMAGHNYGADFIPSTFSFPIRTLHSNDHASMNHPTHAHLASSEHQLRRKTPNGTIDAAYDASPLPHIDGPPPYKQMVISPSSLLLSPEASAQMQPLDRSLSAMEITFARRSGSSGEQTTSWPWRHSSGLAPSLIAAPYPQTWNQQRGMYPDHPRSAIQPVLRANEYNVRAFCPIPMPPSSVLPFGYPDWPVAHWLGDSYHLSAPASPFHHLSAPSPSTYQSFTEYAAPRSDAWLAQQSSLAAGTPHVSLLGPDNGFGHSGQLVSPSRQPGFREKVLAQAHTHYMDLLSCISATRKNTQSKNGQSGRNSISLFLYPKPPNPAHRASCDQVSASEVVSQGMSSFSGNSSTSMFPSLASHHATGSGPGIANIDYHGSRGRQNRLPQSNADWAHEPGGASVYRGGTPFSNAASSLDILTNLCEQSGWKWIDAMLLGGCLLYGLERYSEAFKWFSRILALDECHVESLTNAAATLYCLDRRQEAEQYWLRAVKMQPSYLEAAEHLVGLLYRKRSKDAIEVVTFVQKALRVPQARSSYEAADVPAGLMMSSHADIREPPSSSGDYILDANYKDNHNSPDFGSSGYALPGRDNGRILALVHAKATMLYTLKDVNRAAEAFEEAVLISVGRNMKDVHHLVRYIRAVLMPTDDARYVRQSSSNFSVQPLLLTPDKARQTARLVFAGNGELPGLKLVLNGPSKRAATQTTSNSLLSLAKIFQDAISHGGAAPLLPQTLPGIADILALYYLSLSLQESPSTANNVGILLASVQPELSAPITQTTGSSGPAVVPGVAPGSGLALALAYYQYGLRLDPKHVHLHTNLGSLLKDIGQLDLAIQMYEQAVLCDPSFDIALTNLANAVKDRGRIQDAITYYRRAVQSNPDFAEAVCGLFTALNSVCDWRGRGGVILSGQSQDRWHVNEGGVLVDSQVQRQGSGLAQRVADIVRDQLLEASRWGLHTLQGEAMNDLVNSVHTLFDGERQDLVQALQAWAGKPWEGSRIVRLVERACRVLQRRSYLESHHTRLKAGSGPRHQASNTKQYRRPRLPSSLTVPPAPTVLPFHTFTCPLTADDVRAISQRNAIRISCSTLRSTWLPEHIYPPPSPPNPQLHVGYISSDFNNHPLAHLMQSVFGFHNPQRVKAFCYATTASDSSSHRLKIEREAPVFRDVSTWPPNRLAEQIIQDNIHVLVNLNGYTRGARNEIFAARPAPIQMSFMGFAGSLGAEWCDYLLADTTAVPTSTLRPWRANTELRDVLVDASESSGGGWIYSENVIFCRDTFFCCDHAQTADEAERGISWEAERERRWAMRKKLFPSLDDDAIILGNFNQLYKIEPTTFRTWLRILDKVPKAILWLLRFPEPGEQHLQSTAKAWAGEDVAKRLVFTDVAPKSQHISRARVCDLFLDTPECNAHTTAADVLWSSTPLLTLPRYPYKMCSRMAASILRGALPKTAEGDAAATSLIASSDEQYEVLAVSLASGLRYDMHARVGVGNGRLADLRRLLWDNRWTCGLFDTRRWVSDVEEAYTQAWQHWVNGKQGDIFL